MSRLTLRAYVRRPARPGIHWTHVPGTVIRATGAICQAEIDVIVQTVKGLIDSGYTGSIGVVTRSGNRPTLPTRCCVMLAKRTEAGSPADTAHGFRETNET